jgi:hypothetical protein
MRSVEAQTLDLPIVMTASTAKANARRLLTAAWRDAPNLPLLADADDAGGTELRGYLLASGY